MHPPTAHCPSLLVLLAFLPVACQSSPPPLLASLAPTPDRSFSAEGAWQHLRALSEIGPRTLGSEGAAQARRYIAAELSKLGLEVDEEPFTINLAENEPPLTLANVAVTIPGASQDLLVLAAPYDTVEFESPPLLGVDDGASGPALLLELARVLTVAPLAYSTRLLFLEGDSRTRVGPVETVNIGSHVTAGRFQAQGVMPRIRLLVVFNRVAGTDLRILRDRRSHRVTRESFWDAAAQLGYQDAFPRSAPFESPEAGHVPFLKAGLRPVAAIVGAGPAVDPSSEATEAVAEDTLERCSAESLRTVGIVTLLTLEMQSRRLARIDRVSDVAIPAAVPTTPGKDSTASPSGATTLPSDGPQASEAAPPDDEVAPPATEPEPRAAGAPCATDGLARCPRAPRAARADRPAPSVPEGGSPATGVEVEATTP